MTGPLLPEGWYPDPAAHGLAPEALAPKPQDDPFYTYSGSKPLESIKPGTVLATKRVGRTARGPLGGSFSVRPPAEPDWPVSEHPALR